MVFEVTLIENVINDVLNPKLIEISIWMGMIVIDLNDIEPE